MSAKKYLIDLSSDEQAQLEQIAASNHRSIREKTRARILLLTNNRRESGAMLDTAIAQKLRCTPLTVSQVRRRAIERGSPLAAVVHQEQKRRKAGALSGEQEAHLIALTCSAPPKGRKRWTLQLLKDRLIQMEIVERIGQETIRRTLKKTNSNPGKRRAGASLLRRMPLLFVPWRMC